MLLYAVVPWILIALISSLFFGVEFYILKNRSIESIKYSIDILNQMERDLQSFTDIISTSIISSPNEKADMYSELYTLQNKYSAAFTVRVFNHIEDKYTDLFNTSDISFFENAYISSLNEKLSEGVKEWAYLFGDNQTDGRTLMYTNHSQDNNFTFYFSFPTASLENFKKEDARILVTDNFDKVIYSDYKIEIDDVMKVDFNHLSNDNILISDSYKNFNIYTLTPKNSSINRIKYFMIYYAMSFIFFYFVFKRYSIRSAKETLIEINKLQNHLEFIQKGNFNEVISLSEYDELKSLASSINTMSEKIETLIDRTNKLTSLNVQARIKSLNTQLSPHFLYNTLTTIHYMIAFDNERAQEMIIDLSDIFRYIAKNDSNHVLIFTDLKMTEKYLKLMQMRFENQLSYNFYIDQSIKKLEVPILLIQPIVENSIVYGFKNKNNIHIDISVKKHNNGITIKVEDNAGGIEQGRLVKLKKHIKQGGVLEESTGLYNLIQRLELFYNDMDYKIANTTEGLTVKLFIGVNKNEI